ncbi:hypothetical protein B4N89_46820 [Embleya scabrispora]|uniref:Response regulatory domain-containing protein n=1 Tax=Embleya scabrispora TaxID=159449 RepID=A0A1T3NJ18_9ACTN|nr:hypothetical protein B4N89_46820 [Embleya scabrispora]
MSRAVDRNAAEEAAAAAAAGARYPQLGDAWYVTRQAARQRWPGLVFTATPASRPLPRGAGTPDGADHYDVLLVEDDPADGIIIAEGLREQGTVRTVTRVDDGRAALRFLREQGNARPALIVIDLNIPRMSGQELLTVLSDDPALRAIPVVVLTNSDDPRDVHTAFDLHANAYVTKPVRLDDFLAAVRGIDTFFHSARRETTPPPTY